MPLYLLDTDTVSLGKKGHPAVLARVAAAFPVDVTICPLTIEEALGGWYTYLRKATRSDQIERAYHELVETVKFLSGFRILPYTQAASGRAEALVKSKLGVRKNDLRIAAVALEHNAAVVTRNVRDFGRVPNLVVEDWSAP